MKPRQSAPGCMYLEKEVGKLEKILCQNISKLLGTTEWIIHAVLKPLTQSKLYVKGTWGKLYCFCLCKCEIRKMMTNAENPGVVILNLDSAEIHLKSIGSWRVSMVLHWLSEAMPVAKWPAALKSNFQSTLSNRKPVVRRLSYSQKWMLLWLKMSQSTSRLWKAWGVSIMATSSPSSKRGTVFRKNVSHAICNL